MDDNELRKSNRNNSPTSGEDKGSHVTGEDEMDDEEDIGELMNTKINVEFEARIAENFDFHGIRKLLHQLLLKANVDLSELSNEIIAQNHVGSVIKQVEISDEDDDSDNDNSGEGDVFGVIAVLSLSDDKDLKCVQQLKSMLVERCTKSNAQLATKLSAVLSDTSQHVGLLINERFINIPPQISLPSFNALWMEVEKAKKQKDRYNFASYLLIAKTYVDSATDKQQTQRTFVNAEEEIFFENADATFDYSVRSERDTGISDQWDGDDVVLEPIRTVMLISASKVPAIMQRMTQLLSQ
jgi:protein BCP1